MDGLPDERQVSLSPPPTLAVLQPCQLQPPVLGASLSSMRIEVLAEDCVRITTGDSERAAYLTELMIAVEDLLRVRDADIVLLAAALSELQKVFARSPTL